MKKIIYIFFLFIFFACEKEIKLDIPNAEKEIVVQAMIQEGYPPIVQLTWSDSYFSTIDSNSYNEMFISGAEIIIYNQDRTDSVILAEIDALIQGFPPGIYTDSNINFNANPPFSNFHDFCKEGSSYHLKVIFENDTLTATTSIPNATPLDSIWFVPDDRYPEYGDFYAYYNDPDTMGNNVMFEHKRLAHFSLTEEKDIPDFMFIKAFGAVRNDFEGLNGMGFETFFERGEGTKFDHETLHFKHPGFGNFQMAYINDSVGEVTADIILFRFSQLDKASFEFWRSVIAQDLMNSNPFAEPINLKSNINGGLGIFEGKAAVYYKLIAKEDTTFTQRYYPDIIEIL
jgi:hypothetical protein